MYLQYADIASFVCVEPPAHPLTLWRRRYEKMRPELRNLDAFNRLVRELPKAYGPIPGMWVAQADRKRWRN